ncbi:MAG TPA: hypothetical protein VFE57_13305 [Cyclobacteriaceae bacterium]|jgi:hypothetical protein|nr:hypothetical protein [Cyclobacteriaceae bacterium]
MDNVELKIIKRGLRTAIYKTRNASLILFGLTLLIFLVGESVTDEASASRTMITYVLIISIAILVVALLLTITLFYRRTIGHVTINDDSIFFTDKEKTIKLNKLQIVLNSDTSELENAKKNADDIYKILMTGNRIVSEDLPAEQNGWELILTKENKEELLGLKNESVVLTPQFDSRPVLMESPGRLLKTIAEFGRGWS